MLCFSHTKPKSDWIAPFQSYRALFPTNPTGQFFPVGQFFRPVVLLLVVSGCWVVDYYFIITQSLTQLTLAAPKNGDR